MRASVAALGLFPLLSTTAGWAVQETRIPLSHAPQTATVPLVAQPYKRLGPSNRVASEIRIAQAKRQLEVMLSNRRKLNVDIQPVLTAAVTSIEGTSSQAFEPGGVYVLKGRGFGTAGGTVRLQDPGLRPSVMLKVDHWLSDQIYVTVPADIKGVGDLQRVTLYVQRYGVAQVMQTRKFGFRAARERVRLSRLPSHRINAPDGNPTIDWSGRALDVRRSRYNSDGAACFSPGLDILPLGPALSPGFVLDGYSFSYEPLRRDYRDDMRWTPFGEYRVAASDGDIRVNWGVQRARRDKMVVGGGGAHCNSRYSLEVWVEGPRGISPTVSG